MHCESTVLGAHESKKNAFYVFFARIMFLMPVSSKQKILQRKQYCVNFICGHPHCDLNPRSKSTEFTVFRVSVNKCLLYSQCRHITLLNIYFLEICAAQDGSMYTSLWKNTDQFIVASLVGSRMGWSVQHVSSKKQMVSLSYPPAF